MATIMEKRFTPPFTYEFGLGPNIWWKVSMFDYNTYNVYDDVSFYEIPVITPLFGINGVKLISRSLR